MLWPARTRLIGKRLVRALPNVIVSYVGAVSNTDDQSSYVMSTSIGSAAQLPRWTIIAVAASHGSDASFISATSTPSNTELINNRTGSLFNWIGMFAIATGEETTASITLAFSTSIRRCRAYFWNVYNLGEPLGSTPSVTSAASPAELALTSMTGAAAIAIAAPYGSSARTLTWTNATEREDSTLETTACVSCADVSNLSAGSYTITGTYSGSATTYNAGAVILR